MVFDANKWLKHSYQAAHRYTDTDTDTDTDTKCIFHNRPGQKTETESQRGKETGASTT